MIFATTFPAQTNYSPPARTLGAAAEGLIRASLRYRPYVLYDAPPRATSVPPMRHFRRMFVFVAKDPD